MRFALALLLAIASLPAAAGDFLEVWTDTATYGHDCQVTVQQGPGGGLVNVICPTQMPGVGGPVHPPATPGPSTWRVRATRTYPGGIDPIHWQWDGCRLFWLETYNGDLLVYLDCRGAIFSDGFQKPGAK